MFVHQQRLRHLLRPHHYRDPDHFIREKQGLFRPSWQFICDDSELPKIGDFQTMFLLDTPIIVRRHADGVHAFQNICPHRHSMLTCQATGNMPALKCQYHGWQFKDDGRPSKILEPRAFRPWDRENALLIPVRLEKVGGLYFATLDQELPSLREWLGQFYETIEARYSAPAWKMAEAWEFDAPCNWKVPIENTLESYHIAEVHPTWMGGLLPDEKLSEHTLDDEWTTLRYRGDADPKGRAAWVTKQLGGDVTHFYHHWHIHPNVTFVMTDTFNYMASVVPTGPMTCRVRTRMFPLWGTGGSPWRHFVRQTAWIVGRRIMKTIFNEDRTVYEAQQRGITHSEHRGVIGIREERIYQFQKYVCERTGVAPEIDPAIEAEEISQQQGQNLSNEEMVS